MIPRAIYLSSLFYLYQKLVFKRLWDKPQLITYRNHLGLVARRQRIDCLVNRQVVVDLRNA